MWEDRRGKNIEILNKNRKQQHVTSICTISVLAKDFLASPGWLCAPAKSIHLSLPRCAKTEERERRQEHTPGEVMPSGEKWRKCIESERRNAKKRRELYLRQSVICFTFSSGWNCLCVQVFGFRYWPQAAFALSASRLLLGLSIPYCALH